MSFDKWGLTGGSSSSDGGRVAVPQQEQTETSTPKAQQQVHSGHWLLKFVVAAALVLLVLGGERIFVSSIFRSFGSVAGLVTVGVVVLVAFAILWTRNRK